MYVRAKEAQALFQSAVEEGKLEPAQVPEMLEKAGLDVGEFQKAVELDETIAVPTEKAGSITSRIPEAKTLFQTEAEEPPGLGTALKEFGQDLAPLPNEKIEEFARQAIEAGAETENARASAQVAGHMARVWGIATGRDPAEWFDRYIAGVAGPHAVAPPSKGKFGNAARLFIPGHGVRGVRYVLREVEDEVVPSHDPETFEPQPDYPENVQERDYKGEIEEQGKVAAYSKMTGLEYFLSNNPDAITGPPVILAREGEEDNRRRPVLGGNGRTLAILQAYRAGGPGEKYREGLARAAKLFGYDPTLPHAMKRPALFRGNYPEERGSPRTAQVCERLERAHHSGNGRRGHGGEPGQEHQPGHSGPNRRPDGR